MNSLIRTTSLLVLALLLVSPAPAQERQNPIEKEVKASLKDPTKPFVMYVSIKIKDGTGAKFEAAFAKARTATRKEKGNKAYSLTRSAKVLSEYVVNERWENFEALQAHMKAPHFATLLTEVGNMLDGAPEVKVFIPTRK